MGSGYVFLLDSVNHIRVYDFLYWKVADYIDHTAILPLNLHKLREQHKEKAMSRMVGPEPLRHVYGFRGGHGRGRMHGLRDGGRARGGLDVGAGSI